MEGHGDERLKGDEVAMKHNGTQRVAVLGLGKMGSALARALLNESHSVSVWNRTAAKAADLVASGATLAGSPAEAATEADTVILCVTDHAASLELLAAKGWDDVPAGRTVVQVSTVTPDESRALADRLGAGGQAYLEGSILGYPQMIDDGRCTIVYSGSRRTFEEVRGVLKALGGNPKHLGEAVGSATSFDKTLYAFAYGSFTGYIHGAAMCHALGIPLETYVEEIDSYPIMSMLRNAGDKIIKRDYPGDEATLEIEAAAYQHVVVTSEALGIDTALAKLIEGYFKRSMANGHGEEDLAAMFETMLGNDG